jgi:hypothetical protein
MMDKRPTGRNAELEGGVEAGMGFMNGLELVVRALAEAVSLNPGHRDPWRDIFMNFATMQ